MQVTKLMNYVLEIIQLMNNIKESLNFASATAGISTTKIGPANSMPLRDEIEKIL